MRIGYVIWSLGLGGAEQVVMRLAQAFAQAGHDVTIITLNEPGVFAPLMERLGIPVISVGKRGPVDLSVITRLKRAFLVRKLDVVHTHLWGANLWGRIAAHLARVPVVIATEHNVDTWKRGYHFMIDRWLAPWTTELVAVSQQVREFYESHGVARGRWQVIYNGIDAASALPRGRGSAYQSLGIRHDELVVGLIGRLVPAKAPEIFLEAIAQAAAKVPTLKALVIGDGPLRAATEARARQLGLAERVIFTGLRQDVPELLAGMDALVFSSEREGLSMAMLEAMAAGVPVIATSVGGTPELIESGVSGILVPPHQPQALAEQLTELLTHSEKAETIRRAARQRVEEHFSLSQVVEAHEQLYARGISPCATPPVRLCYVIDHLNVGGAQRQLVELVRALPRAQWEPIVVSLSTTQTALVGELKQAGVEVHLVEQHGAFDPACLSTLTRLLRQLQPKIVHTWLFTADCYGRLAAWFAGVPHTISAMRNTLDDIPWHHRLVNRWLAGGTALITVNAEAIRTGLLQQGGIPAQKIRTIYNGIDLAKYMAVHPNGLYRREWQIPEDGLVIAMVARLAPQKDHATFLEAAHRVAAKDSRVHFVLVGDGPLRETVQSQIDALGLTTRVRLLGERRDVWPLLHHVDGCVLATHYEGCSNVIMEAMAAERPVIATDVGGNRELIVHGETGWLVPPRDPAALAQAMLALLRNPQQAHVMGTRARQRIEADFTMTITVQRTQALYNELLSRGTVN